MSIISQSSIDIVKATAPVVADNAVAITSLFYKNMLGENPQLFQFFNESNQREAVDEDVKEEQVPEGKLPPCLGGNSAQAKTLADAIVAYALNIEDVQKLLGTVERIANKHCALGIKPEHYKVVHDYLMEAIGEVLGEAVTPQVAAAWSEAVMALARIFIKVEGDLYKSTEENQWAGTREMKITKIIQETPQVKSFQMTPTDGKGVYPFTPGQYVSVYEKPDGKEYFAPRHYTLTSQPEDMYYQITVKKLVDISNQSNDGIMSAYLHGKEEGDLIQLGAAFGPNLMASGDSSRAAVFVTVGVGITPAVGMVAKALEERSMVALFHADTSSETFACKRYMEETLDNKRSFVSFSYSNPTKADQSSPSYSPGRLSGEKIIDALAQKRVPANKVDYFICAGPMATPEIVKGLVLQGVPKANIHLEFFGPFMNVMTSD